MRGPKDRLKTGPLASLPTSKCGYISMQNTCELPYSSLRGLAEIVICSHFTDENSGNSGEGRILQTQMRAQAY